jgi:hypothetical protein
MSKIGIIYTAFDCLNHLHDSLPPWFRASLFSKDHEFIFGAVSVPFEEYKNVDPKTFDETPTQLQIHQVQGHIDYLVTEPWYVQECKARGAVLNYLLSQKVDLVWLADADEYITNQQILDIARFVEANEFITWFRLSFKNYFRDDKTYLAEPFTPPRIFRVKSGGYRLHSCSFDNDFLYGGTITRDLLPQERFSSITIPTSVAHIKHNSWNGSPEYLKTKVRYQTSHFKHGAGCGYKWNDGLQRLDFNEDYYRKTGQPIPEIATDA